MGDNSTIRIQFKDNIDIELPIFIQAYLEQGLVQEYLKRCSTKNYPAIPIINAQILLNLPIPIFLLYSETINFTKFYNRQLELLSSAKVLRSKVNKIISKLGNAVDTDLDIYTNHPQLIEKSSVENLHIQEFLEDIHRQTDVFNKLYEKW